MKVVLALIGAFLFFGGSKVLIAKDAPRRSFSEIWSSLSYEKVIEPLDRWEDEGKPTPNNKSCEARQSYGWS
jgi:hypothetical protein